MQHFGTQYYSSSSEDKDESELFVDALKERNIMRRLLKIKNETLPMRKTALPTKLRFWCRSSIQPNPSTFDVAKFRRTGKTL
ncbi:7182_t:CDS:2, partial [Cetraspora pellucida]